MKGIRNERTLRSMGNMLASSSGITSKAKPLAHAWSGILGFLARKEFLHLMQMNSFPLISRVKMCSRRPLATISFAAEMNFATSVSISNFRAIRWLRQSRTIGFVIL